MKRSCFYWVVLLVGLLPRAGRAQSDYQKLAQLVSPPGTVLVRDSLWLDEAEVANIHWLEYLHSLRKDSTEEHYQRAKPTVASWLRFDSTGAYIELPCERVTNGLYYPVTGITYEQATRYSRWRSAIVNQRIHSEAYLRKHPELKKYDFRVEYHLPSVREWELAAASKLDPAAYPLGMVHPPPPGSKQARKQLISNATEIKNCLVETGISPAASGPLLRMEFTVQEEAYFGITGLPVYCRNAREVCAIPAYVYANSPNAYGLYNLIGNVAELTATPGVAKGGSFYHSIKDVSVLRNFAYTQPQMWLGFRCACTVRITPQRPATGL